MKQGTSLFYSEHLIRIASVSDSSCARRFFHTLEDASRVELYGQLINDGYLFFWQSVTMLDASGERIPGSEQGR